MFNYVYVTCILVFLKNPFLACEENSVKWYKIFKNPLLIGRWFWIGGRRYWVFSYKVKKKHQREKKIVTPEAKNFSCIYINLYLNLLFIFTYLVL